jgi:hypothetical protein
LAPLIDISGFLYNFNLVYEIARLATDRTYDRYAFSSASFYARGRPLRPDDRLRVVRLATESPLDLVAYLPAVLPAAGAVFAVTFAVTRVAREPIDLAKTVAEIRKLGAETRKLNAEARKFDVEAVKLASETKRNVLEARRIERDLAGPGMRAELDEEDGGQPERWIATSERAIAAPPFTTEKRLQRRLSRREALTWFNRATDRLGRSGLEIEHFDVELVTEVPPPS